MTLDHYEQAIVESLVRDYGYTLDEALAHFLRYKSVFDRMDRYDNAEDKARYLDKAIRENRSPEAWHAHINKMDAIRQRTFPFDFREAFRMGYFYGRLDAQDGKPYDDRTPAERVRDRANPRA